MKPVNSHSDYIDFMRKYAQKTPLPTHFDACLVIDVQDKFCCPAKSHFGSYYTLNAAQNVQQFAPQLRAHDIHLYSIYYDITPYKDGQDDFIHYQHTDKDTLIRKNAPSAFEGFDNGLKEKLTLNKHFNLLVMGVYLDACVAATAMDAAQLGFKPWVVLDCSGSVKGHNNFSPKKMSMQVLDDMRAKGVGFTLSNTALDQIKPT
ncbi:MAG: cysteine hydrolase family protein [Alphaproteobacteria bacterium]